MTTKNNSQAGGNSARGVGRPAIPVKFPVGRKFTVAGLQGMMRGKLSRPAIMNKIHEAEAACEIAVVDKKITGPGRPTLVYKTLSPEEKTALKRKLGAAKAREAKQQQKKTVQKDTARKTRTVDVSGNVLERVLQRRMRLAHA